MKLEVETTEKEVMLKLALPRKTALAFAAMVMAWSGSAQASQVIVILQSALTST